MCGTPSQCLLIGELLGGVGKKKKKKTHQSFTEEATFNELGLKQEQEFALVVAGTLREVEEWRGKRRK